ncbi:autotransporter domain-containing protein [Bosea sp. (in: a-proteobacteria)]|uniref:autotransporter-associated beta strand repeat-containing protein n=2 Tax=Bosea sp. (in: a-proteobacteria) TaxID=1871050 RepID=UPI0031FE4530
MLDGETATIAVTITGSEGLEKTGDGTLILSGSNSYSGGTIISGGTLQISADGNLGAVGGGLTFDNGTLRTTADISTTRGFTLRGNGAIETAANTTLSVNATVSGAGGLIKSGAGTLLLTGTNSWSGGTLITAGTLRAGSAGALPTMTDWVLTGGRLDLDGYDLSMRFLAGSGGEIALGGADLIVDQAKDSVYAGTVTGSGRLLKDGSGTLLLTGTSSYSGGTVIRDGTLAIVADANLGNAGSAIAFDGGGRLATYADITSGRSVTLFGTGTIETYAGTTFTLGGSISGSGSLAKQGWGTLTLTGSAAHTGGTTIAAGMLQIGNGGTTGDLAGDVVNNAVLSFNRSNDYGFSGVISGSGVVVQAGTGTTVLTGANTYSGGTLIRAGVLQVSNDGNLGASGTAIAFSGGALRYGASFGTDRTVLLAGDGTIDTNGYDGTLSGGVYGDGDLIKTGAGTLTLAGMNAYRNTIVVAGTLVGDAASISGNVTANGTVVFDQRDDASIAGVFSGSGRFDKTGRGALELTGDSFGFAGSTTVSAGTLVVNGALGGALDVQSGARLQGSGTVGSTTIQSGATIAPGNSIGTLTVAGNVSFAGGSTYQVEVNAAGQSDRIAASGSATLSGGTVQVLAENGNYAASTSYTILTATGGVAGQFSTVTSNLAFLTPSLVYDSNNVTLTMARNDASFGPDNGGSGSSSRTSIAQTRNQGFIAIAAERLGVGNPVYDTLISGTAAEARAGFDLLSGEAHAQAVSVIIEESRLVRDTILGHLRGPLLTALGQQVAGAFTADLPGRKGAVVMPAPVPQPRYAVWGTAFGSTGNTDADGNAASLNRRSGGALLGADLMLYDAPGSSLKLGVAGGYSQSRFDLDARLSSGRLESGHAALYAGARFGNLRLDAGAAYTWSESDIRRQVQIRGFGDLLRLQRPGSVTQGFAELGYAFAFSGFTVEPFAQLALIRVSTDAGTERGGAAALRVLSSEQTLGFTTLGLRAEAQLGAMPLFARAMLGWRHGFGELTPQARTAFVAGTTPATVFAARIDGEALIAEAGLDWRLSQATALGLTYSAAVGERSRDHALKGKVEMRF